MMIKKKPKKKKNNLSKQLLNLIRGFINANEKLKQILQTKIPTKRTQPSAPIINLHFFFLSFFQIKIAYNYGN